MFFIAKNGWLDSNRSKEALTIPLISGMEQRLIHMVIHRISGCAGIRLRPRIIDGRVPVSGAKRELGHILACRYASEIAAV